jgi:hypothetical protein
MFVRRNDSASELLGHSEFRFRVGVAVPLKAPNEDGFPGNDEMEQLNVIEDTLSSRLEAEQQSLQVLAITTGGMREFVFYTRDAAAAKAILEQLRATESTHELQGYIAEDPKWSAYRQFA